MSVDVGGTTAGYVDLAAAISDKLIITIGVVVALSFVLLLLAFRSIVIPLTAGLMNLVSIGAAFGVVTAVFEKGWGASLVGLAGEVPIVSFVPLMMFAILFGLSMDYEVFLMTHIREHWLETGDNKESVIRGIATTGRVITSAALIMVSVFFAFILNGDPTVKQFGVGMGVAVAVDATIVRCLLVPAVMVLIGKANWWFPRWMDKVVPNFSIEGEEWFRERDAAAADQAAKDEDGGARPDVDRVAAVVADDDAAVRQPGRRRLRPAEQRRLRQDLGLERGRRERGDLRDAGERRAAGRRVEQVVGGAAVGAEPGAAGDPARRDARVGQLERVQRAAAERVGDVHRPRPPAADAQVAGGGDDELVGVELLGDEVGEQALGEAAAVDADAGRAVDGVQAGADRAPALAPARARPDGGAARAGARARAAARAAASRPRSRRPRSRRPACRRRGRPSARRRGGPRAPGRAAPRSRGPRGAGRR